MTITLSITLATRDDAVAIAHLSRVNIEYGLPWRYRPRRIEQMIGDPESNVIVARDAHAVAGFGAMRYADDRAHLYLLAVDPMFRRRGVARALLSWLEDSARTAGTGIITLECRSANAQALAFYESAGYRVIGRMPCYYHGQEDGVRLGRDLWA
jgi:ribosomal-protein-alanine N-acetyltransferase